MDTFVSWLKSSLGGLSIIFLSFLFIFVFVFFPVGCAVDEWIKVPVSSRIQKATGEGNQVTLKRAPEVFERYLEVTSKEARLLYEDIQDAQWAAGVWGSLAEMGIELGGQSASAAFPGLGLAIPALTALGGSLFIRKPGDAKRMADQEKQMETRILALREDHAKAIDAQSKGSYKKGKEDFREALSTIGPLVGHLTNGNVTVPTPPVES
mgnify:CR=1 FL=1